MPNTHYSAGTMRPTKMTTTTALLLLVASALSGIVTAAEEASGSEFDCRSIKLGNKS